ncbi:hypothetical protein [Alteraurantiacibacter buctensis]|uniref:Uncharacterized protein n=1 Tax=Alteraurantiacibacter buctensis TaxID=1503981 RepID=A0A844Z0M0_9SPHN|nr:hypothetical protein [Alteraurantiacibacter buctensis]MXO72254.1 hypothetical protein [Alteraurantiacibacter buctensis]
MATEKDIEAPLTLELNGEDLTPELFVRGVRSFFAVLNQLTDQIDDTVGWRVQVKQGSNLIGVYPNGGANSASVGSIYSSIEAGLSSLERDAEEPENFPPRALEGVRDLAKISLGADADIGVRVWVEKRPHGLSAHSIANIDDILKSGFEEHGAVVGRIETISEHGNAKFIIFQPLDGNAVHCIVPPERLPDALKAFGHRAEVYGLVRYGKDDKPKRIKVEDITIFPPDDELPSAYDVVGLLRNSPR